MYDSKLEIVLAARDITRKNFEAVNDRIKRMAKSALSFNSILLATAGATGGMALMVKESLRVNDALAKTSDKLGIATEDLAALRYAGELTGVSVKQFDTALQRMVRRIAEAAQGTGEARGAIRELGIDAETLARMSPDKAFARIAERMKDVTTQGDRVRLAMKLFDSEGVALVNTLKLGSEGLQQAAKDAERLGITISRVDAAQIEAANDASLRLNKAMDGIGNTLTVAVAPGITKAADGMAEWIAQNNKFIESGLTGYLADVSMFLRDIKRLSDDIDFSAGGWLNWENLIPGRGALNLYKSLRGIGGGDAANDAAMGDLEAGAFPPSYFRGSEAAAVSAASDPAVVYTEKAAELMDAHVRVWEERIKRFEEARRQFLAENDTDDIVPLVNQELIGKMVEETETAFEKMQKSAERAGWGMRNSFAEFFDVTSQGFLDLEDLARGVAGSISRTIADDMAKYIVGSTGVYGDAPGGLLGMLFNAKGNVFSGGHLQAYGKGGVVNRPTVFPLASGAGIVSEYGQDEGIFPLARMSNNDLGVRGVGGGGQPINIFHISAVDAKSFSDKLEREGEGPIVNLVTKNLMHNGVIRSVIRGVI